MKPKTYTQIYIHLIFAVKNRDCLLRKQNRDKLFRYVSGILGKQKCKSIIVNGYSDHIHILTGLNPNISISDLVREVKRSSSLHINSEKWFQSKFSWQDGYGAFSHSRSQIEKVFEYIKNQELHHGVKQTFKDEYLAILRKNEIEFENEYVFIFFS